MVFATTVSGEYGMELELIVYFVLSYALGVLGIWFLRHKITMWIAENTWNYIVEELKSPENQKALQENIAAMVLEPLRQRLWGTLGGVAKGVSNQMRGIENEVVAQGIDAATGMPVGELALGLIQKYPVLKQVLPILLAQMGKKQGQTGAGLP